MASMVHEGLQALRALDHRPFVTDRMNDSKSGPNHRQLRKNERGTIPDAQKCQK